MYLVPLRFRLQLEQTKRVSESTSWVNPPAGPHEKQWTLASVFLDCAAAGVPSEAGRGASPDDLYPGPEPITWRDSQYAGPVGRPTSAFQRTMSV